MSTETSIPFRVSSASQLPKTVRFRFVPRNKDGGVGGHSPNIRAEANLANALSRGAGTQILVENTETKESKESTDSIGRGAIMAVMRLCVVPVVYHLGDDQAPVSFRRYVEEGNNWQAFKKDAGLFIHNFKPTSNPDYEVLRILSAIVNQSSGIAQSTGNALQAAMLLADEVKLGPDPTEVVDGTRIYTEALNIILAAANNVGMTANIRL